MLILTFGLSKFKYGLQQAARILELINRTIFIEVGHN